jgi:ketosteroid isomerase-like protein
MMQARPFSLGVAALALVIGCHTAPEFTAQDEAMVREMFSSGAMWVQEANVTAWAGQFADDAVLLPPNGRAVHGRAAIQAWAEAMPALEQFSLTDVQVRGDGDLAWGTSTIARKSAGLPAATGKELVVFRRDPMASWQIIALSFNFDSLPSQPAGAAPR